MLSNISWSQYILGVAVVLTVYYLFLFIPWKKFRPNRQGEDPGAIYNSQNLEETSVLPKEEEETGDDEFGVAEELAGRLREIIQLFGQQNFVKEELLSELQGEIALYPSLNRKEFRTAFNELIREEVNDKCAVALSVRELDELWG